MKTSINFLLMVIFISPALMVLPTVASDYTLGIYGNANMDDTIDEEDISYIEGVIRGENAATNLSDANYDGKIDESDIDLIKQIISRNGKEITIIDDTATDTFPNGQPVKIVLPVKRIVALHSRSINILTLLDSDDKVVGIERSISNHTKLFPLISNLPIVGSMSDPDAEKILQLEPDIVIAYGSDFTKRSIDLEKKLSKTNITLVRLDCFKPETMSDDIIKLGYILNKKDEAIEFINWYEYYLSIIKDRVEKLTGKEKPRVFLGSYPGYTTYSNDTGAHQACIMAGGINIAADLPFSYPDMDPEWVISQNPDSILYVVSSSRLKGGYEEDESSQMEAAWDEVMNRSELKSVKAISDNKVYLIHGGGVWNSPTYFIGLMYLGKWFHPDLFEDLDPKAIHQEYLTRFQGLDYDLDEHGVFVYPQPGEN